jgi:polar amino acid transport system substrate-binding protein
MKKLLAVLLSGVMVFSMTACGSKESTETGDKETTAKTESGAKTFNVGFDAEYPPYGYMDSETGEYTGFDLELAQAVCDLEGWELIKTPIDWDSKDLELNSGNIDCIWNGFTMNGRENEYTFSVPYVNNTQVIVVKSDSDIEKLDDLKDKYVAAQKASAAESLLAEGGDQEELGKTFKQLDTFGDYNTAFAELDAGTVDAIAVDVGVAKYQIESRGDAYKMLDEELNSEQYAVGFKKGNTELQDIINKDLAKLNEDGTVAKLAEKYGIADMICLGE